jgi:hypothetical protein
MRSLIFLSFYFIIMVLVIRGYRFIRNFFFRVTKKIDLSFLYINSLLNKKWNLFTPERWSVRKLNFQHKTTINYQLVIWQHTYIQTEKKACLVLEKKKCIIHRYGFWEEISLKAKICLSTHWIISRRVTSYWSRQNKIWTRWRCQLA